MKSVEKLVDSIDNYDFRLLNPVTKKLTDNPAMYYDNGERKMTKQYAYGVEIDGEFHEMTKEEMEFQDKKNAQLRILKADCNMISNKLSEYKTKIIKSREYVKSAKEKLKSQEIGGIEQDVLKIVKEDIELLDSLEKDVESLEKYIRTIANKIN